MTLLSASPYTAAGAFAGIESAGLTGPGPLAEVVGADLGVPLVTGETARYVNLDYAASAPALRAVADQVTELLPLYSSVHRGAGFKSRASTAAYEEARQRVLEHCGRTGGDHVAILCRNTTEALNHLAYRLDLARDDAVLTTVVEHHANLLPWGRVATRRYVECGPDGTFTVDDVVAGLDAAPRPRLLALTGASNVTGWLPPLDAIVAAASDRGVPVFLDAAQLAPHRPLTAPVDYLAFSGHKIYAPYGAGILVGPRATFADGDPFLAGGGAVDLVDLDEVLWTDPPEREEAGSPNVVGAVALEAALGVLTAIGWGTVAAHEAALARRLRTGLDGIDGVTLLGPSLDTETLAIAAFTVAGLPHALVAARLSAEFGIGVRHGCFCAHPYLIRLLGLSPAEIAAYRRQVLAGDHSAVPGAVRASCGLSSTAADVDALLAAVAALAASAAAGHGTGPVRYDQDPRTGDFWPVTDRPGWTGPDRDTSLSCARG
ncbi:MAG: aminotransferase class V-fold PLP-dependent enzyme [Acidimicrobiales bacterium]